MSNFVLTFNTKALNVIPVSMGKKRNRMHASFGQTLDTLQKNIIILFIENFR